LLIAFADGDGTFGVMAEAFEKVVVGCILIFNDKMLVVVMRCFAVVNRVRGC
jgi:hypothetical protein